MNIGHVRTAHVVVTYPQQPLAEAARLMRKHHVGSLVVLDPHDPQRRPHGVLTDRDIVCGQISKASDLHCLTVADVMSRDPLCLGIDMSLGEGIAAMTARAVRRAPVVDREGSLVGIVSLDDLIPAVASELRLLAQLMGTQAHRRDAR
jgi:CBS domain-containing protein